MRIRSSREIRTGVSADPCRIGIGSARRAVNADHAAPAPRHPVWDDAEEGGRAARLTFDAWPGKDRMRRS
jgi:hypothetical protein